MRGKLIQAIVDALPQRITPADAGKTDVCCQVRAGLWDHPRGCGENDESAVLDAINTGSPPRMRGKLHLSQKLFEYIGITPADAGKTGSDSCRTDL